MRFFLDNCLSPHLARALNQLDPANAVIHLRDKFGQSVDDPTWIGALAQERDWVIVSGDVRIPKNPQNRQAGRQSNLTAFFLVRSWTNQPGWDQAWRLVRWWPHITRQAQLVTPGKGFWVPLNYGGKRGKFELVQP